MLWQDYRVVLLVPLTASGGLKVLRLFTCTCRRTHVLNTVRSVPGKCSWALTHYWPVWVFTQDVNIMHLYGGCYTDPMKHSAWALTWEWVLAQDTTVMAYT